MTFTCLLLYGRRLSDKNIAENEAMICSAAWWKQWISPRFKSSFLVLFCFLYGVTYKPSRAGQNCYTWWCYSQWMYLQVTIIKIYLSIYLCMATSKNLCPNLVTKGSLVGNHIDDLAKDCSLSIANTLHVAVLHFSQICTHERHPIPHLYQQTMGCLLRVIHAKMTMMYWERMSYCFYSCRTIAAAANVICFVLVTDVK